MAEDFVNGLNNHPVTRILNDDQLGISNGHDYCFGDLQRGRLVVTPAYDERWRPWLGERGPKIEVAGRPADSASGLSWALARNIAGPVDVLADPSCVNSAGIGYVVHTKTP